MSLNILFFCLQVIATVTDKDSNMDKTLDVFGVKMTHFRKQSNRYTTDESDRDSSVNSFQIEDLENEPYVIFA